MNCVIYDHDGQEESFDLLVFLSNWLLRLVDERFAYPTRMMPLPLNEEVPYKWRRVPEFLIEIITDYILHIARYFLTGRRLTRGTHQISCVIGLGRSWSFWP